MSTINSILNTAFAIALAFGIILFLLPRLDYRRLGFFRLFEEWEREKKKIPTPFYPLFNQDYIEFLHDDWKEKDDDLKRKESFVRRWKPILRYFSAKRQFQRQSKTTTKKRGMIEVS